MSIHAWELAPEILLPPQSDPQKKMEEKKKGTGTGCASSSYLTPKEFFYSKETAKKLNQKAFVSFFEGLD